MEWRPAPNFPDHEVSEYGDVRRVNDGRGLKAGAVLAGYNQNGYRMYKLCRNGEKVKVFAHRLVCEAWHGAPDPMRPMVAHWDGSKDNNHYSNLRWASCKENLADRVRHGTHPTGSRNGRAVLTEDDVRRIRQEYKGERGQMTKLSKRHGVSLRTVYSIVNNHNWSGVY